MTDVPEIPAMPAIPEDPQEMERRLTNLNDAFRARCALGALINQQPEDAQRHLDAISHHGLQDVAQAAQILARMARETY